MGDGRLAPRLLPLARGLVPFVFTGEVLRHTLTGGEPSGAYAWLAALTLAGRRGSWAPSTSILSPSVREAHAAVGRASTGPGAPVSGHVDSYYAIIKGIQDFSL